ncbi:MAG TPA: hypothetical protein VIS30_05800 [Candidatus Deferrimicrobiaceae bacterium]
MTLRRESTAFALFVGLGLGALLLLFAHASWREGADREAYREKREIVRALGLTDLCLFTEARYTRHPAVADRFTPFQDHPLSLEHFPSASLLLPPPHLVAP